MTTADQTWLEPAIDKKIYRNQVIRVATFLGGPLIAGYMIAQNYKVFNEPDKAKMTWVYCLIATAIIFAGAFSVPETVKVPKIIIPLIYSWATYYLVQQLQGTQIDTRVKAGGQIYSWWQAIAVSLIGVVITFAIIFVILFFLPNS